MSKPALRNEVKDVLQQAGFKNIRIVSESFFLVRALDQNGDAVVMVIRPDLLRTMRAPADEDEGEANAEESGRPDPWSDFSKIPKMTRSKRLRRRRQRDIGKSSKMSDRPPAAESDQQAQAGQNGACAGFVWDPIGDSKNDTATLA